MYLSHKYRYKYTHDTIYDSRRNVTTSTQDMGRTWNSSLLWIWTEYTKQVQTHTNHSEWTRRALLPLFFVFLWNSLQNRYIHKAVQTRHNRSKVVFCQIVSCTKEILFNNTIIILNNIVLIKILYLLNIPTALHSYMFSWFFNFICIKFTLACLT